MVRQMLLRQKRLTLTVIILILVTVGGSAVGALALERRSTQLDRLIYDQCVANEQQDTVIVAQLEAAKTRAMLTLPPNSAELNYQLEILNDGIATLEPPGEHDCPTPEGTQP